MSLPFIPWSSLEWHRNHPEFFASEGVSDLSVFTFKFKTTTNSSPLFLKFKGLDFGISLCPMLTKYKLPCSYHYDICNRKRTLMAAYLSHSCLPTRLGHTRLSWSNSWTWTRKLSLGQILILKLIDVRLAHPGSNHSHLEVQNTEVLEVG